MPMEWMNECFVKFRWRYPPVTRYALRQVHRLFQNEFFRECNLVLPATHERFWSLRLRFWPNEKYFCIWKCANWPLFNRGDQNGAACSITRVTRLSLDDCLYKWKTKKYMCQRPLTTIASFLSVKPTPSKAISLR
jgi:hypothetical protein